MATEAQLRAIKKWSTFAKAHGETVNAFVNRLIRDAMTAEKNGTPRTK